MAPASSSSHLERCALNILQPALLLHEPESISKPEPGQASSEIIAMELMSSMRQDG